MKSEETRRRISESKKGAKNPNFGKSTWNKGKKEVQIPSLDTRLKMSAAHRGNKSRLGLKHSLETRKRMSVSRGGAKHWHWRGGLTTMNHSIRNSFEYRLWRAAVFLRDNYTCLWCGTRGGRIEADHIQRFTDAPDLRFAIDNGRTLCHSCHKLRHKS